MFYTRFKTILFITILFVISSFTVMVYADCDMMAMLAKNGSQISDFNEADYFFQFQKDQSSPDSGDQDDGYGVVYYKNGEYKIPFEYVDPLPETNQAFFLIGEADHSWYQHHGPSSDYYWNDSITPDVINYPVGPNYEWITRPGYAIPVEFTHNDTGVVISGINFEFVFYSVTYYQFIINPNGWIGFVEDENDWENTSLPNSDAPKPAIFGFWDDLDPISGGNVYYLWEDNQLIVWYDHVEKYGDSGTTFDFQIILFNDGKIKIQYQSVVGTTNSGTIGIQNAYGTEGLQVVYNGNYTYNDSYVENELALLFSTEPYPEPLDIAQDSIMYAENEAVIVLGHDRNRAGVSSLAVGQHPYTFEWGDTTYTFQHNGFHDYKNPMRKYCWDHDLDWFITHPLNWEILGNTIYDLDTVNDTEILFHYIMANVIEAGGNVVEGMLAAFNETEIEDDDGNVHNIRRYFHEDWRDNRINVTLSDGDALYVFRNTSINDGYNLSYKDYGNYVGVKTKGDIPDGGIRIVQFALMEITRDGDIIAHDDDISVSGPITENTEWNYDHYVVGDLTIESGVTLTLLDGANLYFTDKYDVTVNGELILNEGAGLHLYHHSAVIVDGLNARLFFDWGTSISGYEKKLRCECCPGDRIISQNGGVITTRTKFEYENYPGPGTPPPIEIYSDSDMRWNGFVMKSADDDYTCEFTNCNVSGIRGITMTGRNNNGYLNIYYSRFDDCNSIYVRDINLLRIEGSSDNHCEFTNFVQSAIFVHGSDIYISYADISDNGWHGLHLVYQSTGGGDDFGIFNCYIHNNDGNGICLNDYAVYECSENYIYSNDEHGIYSWDGTITNEISNNVIENNLKTEYIGKTAFFLQVPDENNTFNDPDPNNGGYWDQYVLASLDWETGDPQIPVYGNTIPQQNDHSRFYPYWETFDFDNGGVVPDERQQLNLAFGYIKVQAFEPAIPILKGIIEDYPETKEASIALKTLYYIENQTENNYAELRDYIETIQADSSSYLASAKKDVVIKTYMKDQDYLTAIEKIEEKIAALTSEDEIIYAMLDEAYCELMLLIAGYRSSFTGYSVNIQSEEDFFVQSKELESMLSAFRDFEQQPDNPIVTNLNTLQNYPNPFNPSTTISFNLNTEDTENTELTIYNIKGQKVKTLIDEQLGNGTYSVIWNGKDSDNKNVASGIYFYKISAGKETQVKKMLLLK